MITRGSGSHALNHKRKRRGSGRAHRAREHDRIRQLDVNERIEKITALLATGLERLFEPEENENSELPPRER